MLLQQQLQSLRQQAHLHLLEPVRTASDILMATIMKGAKVACMVVLSTKDVARQRNPVMKSGAGIYSDFVVGPESKVMHVLAA